MSNNILNCTAASLADRAQQELAAAMVALQQAGALFSAIEKACVSGDKDLPFLLAQVGAETTSYQAERCSAECDFFGAKQSFFITAAEPAMHDMSMQVTARAFAATTHEHEHA
jgi:hypothetical protein